MEDQNQTMTGQRSLLCARKARLLLKSSCKLAYLLMKRIKAESLI